MNALIIIENQRGFCKKKEDDITCYYVAEHEEKRWIPRDELMKYIVIHRVANAMPSGNGIRKINTVCRVRKLREYDRNIIEKNIKDYIDKDTYGYNQEYVFFMQKISDDSYWKYLMENALLALYGNQHIALFFIEKLLNVNIVDMMYLPYGYISSELTMNYIDIISSKIENSIFWITNGMDNLNPKYKHLDLTSTFGDRPYRNSGRGAGITEYNPCLMRDVYEQIMFPKIDNQDNIEVKAITNSEMNRYVMELNSKLGYKLSAYWGDRFQTPSISGFTYLHPKDSSKLDETTKFLCAIYKGTIIGVIYFGVWGNNRYQSISYIDISSKYKRMGIATMLIKSLNKYLRSDLPLVITDLSDEGKAARIDLIFKKYITKTKLYTYSEALEKVNNL